METKHTPGPWEVFTPPDMGDLGNIEDVYEVCEGALVATPEQRAARARIIAAAPDMLAALKAAKSIIERLLPYECEDERETDARINAAIAKAEGR